MASNNVKLLNKKPKVEEQINKINKINIIKNKDNAKLKSNKNTKSQNKNTDPGIIYINERIKKEICYDTISALTDANLLHVYKECKSVKKAINKLENILDKFIILEIKNKIINEYLLELIPPGTKGVYRGNKFNEIVKKYILNFKLNTERFDVCFEKNCIEHITSEKPDWYIQDKLTNKIIIGMNQLDLWGGGQQINRGSKYIIDNKNNTIKSKLLCVVCNELQFVGKENKTYKLFKIGFENNTLCYLNNLHNIIITYFN